MTNTGTTTWRCTHEPVEQDEEIALGDYHYFNPNARCRGGCGMALTIGERFDQIAERMDAAYATRKEVAKVHKPGTAQYVAADDAIEAVYADLRVLNREIGA